MYTVSKRANDYKQPRGGFIPPSTFEKIKIEDGIELKEENISPGIIGTVVDYMVRFLNGSLLDEAFAIPMLGAKLLKKEKEASQLLDSIDGLDDNSIIAACKIVAFDAVVRAGVIAYKPIEEINPDEHTVFNIKTMIKRCQKFIENYGPIVDEGMTFIGGYTETVVSGDADFMTEDTIWDLKVTKNAIKSSQTLQILMYYLMGCRTIILNADYDFKNKIKKIGIYNPRLNEIYIKSINEIDEQIIKEVEEQVIGYNSKSIDPHLKSMLDKIEDK